MKANPGGQLAPDEVFGRDELIARLWRILERQSIVLSAERRMGKTQVIKKMEAEAPQGKLPIYHDLEGVRSPVEFVEIVFHDVERYLSRWNRTAERARLALTQLAGAEVAGVKFPDTVAPHWKTLLSRTIEDLAAEQRDLQVVFLWDELPLMLHNIRVVHGEAVAMELLDTLRALRQSHASLRMVFTGSVGLHHVLTALRKAGYTNPSTNDMFAVEVLPLEELDAEKLARNLLNGEQIQCSDLAAVANAISIEANCVPFFIHHLVEDVASQHLRATPEAITNIADERLRDPQDSWHLRHFVERVEQYYPAGDAKLAYAVLDALAVECKGLAFDDLFGRVKARVVTEDADALRGMLALLQRDHYLVHSAGGKFSFRLPLVGKAWRIHRALV
jgi:hypothetical protein